jgi:hypothetical protein
MIFLVKGVQVRYRFTDCHALVEADLWMACSSAEKEHCQTETVHFVFSSLHGLIEMVK